MLHTCFINFFVYICLTLIIKTEIMKFKIGTKVKVKADLTFKGLTGIVKWYDKDEDGNIHYLLKDINFPKMIDKNGKEYKINKSFFYEDWLKIVN